MNGLNFLHSLHRLRLLFSTCDAARIHNGGWTMGRTWHLDVKLWLWRVSSYKWTQNKLKYIKIHFSLASCVNEPCKQFSYISPFLLIDYSECLYAHGLFSCLFFLEKAINTTGLNTIVWHLKQECNEVIKKNKVKFFCHHEQSCVYFHHTGAERISDTSTLWLVLKLHTLMRLHVSNVILILFSLYLTSLLV